jgi:CheY-like chemotaxis protein
MVAPVLLVEDDEYIRESLAEIVEDEGYRVVVASNGQEALAWVQGTGEAPAMILLDLMMPVMNGHEFIRALRELEDPRKRETPVIVLTASREHPSGPGIIAALRKPIDLGALLEAMRGASSQAG